MSSNFNFYMNRQGIQGVRGPKGEQGFSPIITVKTETAAEYVLKIENEDGSFDTPNLRGNALVNTGGSYVRYNPETSQMYVGGADSASTESAGEIRLSTYEELEAGLIENAVPSAMDVHDFVQNSISAISGFVTTSDFDTYTTATDAALLSLSTNKLNKSTYDSYVLETASTLNSLSTNKLDASTFNSYTNTTDNALNTLDTNKLDFTDLTSTLVQGSNVTLTTDAENKTITISATGGGSSYTDGNGIDITNDVISAKVDGTTIDFDNSGNLTVIGGGGTQVQANWNESDPTDPSYIQNKPSIPAAQVQSDWNQADSDAVDFIKNKPTIPTAPSIATSSTVGLVKPDESTIHVNNTGTISTINMVKSTDVTNIVSCTQAEYDALISGGTVDTHTFYIITPASNL